MNGSIIKLKNYFPKKKILYFPCYIKENCFIDSINRRKKICPYCPYKNIYYFMDKQIDNIDSKIHY